MMNFPHVSALLEGTGCGEAQLQCIRRGTVQHT
jgi:hypothetical protein